VESLERFEQNQLIIEEFVSQWLAVIPSDFGRLAHVSRLRDVTTGRYNHPELEEVYSSAAAHQALLYCHEDLFQKALELPLEPRNGVCGGILRPWKPLSTKSLSAGSSSSTFAPSCLSAPLRIYATCSLSNARAILSLLVREQAAAAATA
jgi:hypothetical protein